MKSVSAADANRHFSALLREVSRGERITVTSRGKPVATIAAVDTAALPEREAAKRALLSRLRSTGSSGKRTWSRDDLYD